MSSNFWPDYMTSGACPVCIGTKTVQRELNFGQSEAITCPLCNGLGFVMRGELDRLHERLMQIYQERGSLVAVARGLGLSYDEIERVLSAVVGVGNSSMPASREALDEDAEMTQAEIVIAPVIEPYQPEIEGYSLHSLKGLLVMKMTIVGGRANYTLGQAVTHDDFRISPRLSDARSYRFNGVIRKCLVTYRDRKIYREIEIELSDHELRANGTYKMRGVHREGQAQPGPAPTPTNKLSGNRPAPATENKPQPTIVRKLILRPLEE